MSKLSENFLKTPFSHKHRIGVMGSAQGPSIVQKENTELAMKIGAEIAKSGNILLNGACPGLPNDAAIAAKKEGGFVMGVSPAFSRKEHIDKFSSPVDPYDMILYTGQGLMYRDIANIRFSDAIIVLGGGMGTLNEFSVAFDEGRYVGVLTSTTGISQHIKNIIKQANREEGGRVFYDDDPKKLVAKIIHALEHGPRVTTEDERIVDKYSFLV